jgi:hypothetical protein
MPAVDSLLLPRAGLTVREVARLYRVSPDKVRGWIKSPDPAKRLGAINTSNDGCRKPRYIVLPHHLAEFERLRLAGPAPRPAKRRKRITKVDYYPD